MATINPDLKYSAEHEWVDDSQSPVRIGITSVAADALGDIVYLDLPEVGAQLTAGQVCGEVESTKSVSDIYSPVSGTVVSINDAAVNDPAVVNTDPFGEGWLLLVEMSEAGPLLTPEQYAEHNDAQL